MYGVCRRGGRDRRKKNAYLYLEFPFLLQVDLAVSQLALFFIPVELV